MATIIERLEELKSLLFKREQGRIVGFRGLVKSLADGKVPNADRVEEILRDNGKTVADLQKAVEVLQQRRQLRQKLDALPKLAMESEELRGEIVKADDVFNRARQIHSETVGPLRHRLTVLNQEDSAAHDARQRLIEGCPYPELLEQLADVRKRMTEAAKVKRTADADLDRMKYVVGQYKDRVEHADSPFHRQEAAGHLPQAEANLAQRQQEAAAAETAVAALVAEEEAIMQKMLEP